MCKYVYACASMGLYAYMYVSVSASIFMYYYVRVSCVCMCMHVKVCIGMCRYVNVNKMRNTQKPSQKMRCAKVHKTRGNHTAVHTKHVYLKLFQVKQSTYLLKQ